MAVFFRRSQGFLLFFFTSLCTTVWSLNDTNVTLTTTEEPFTSTEFFTSTQLLTTTEEPITGFICLNTGRSTSSGLFEIDEMTVNDHRVWTMIRDTHEYNILFYTIEQRWIITRDVTMGDGWMINDNKMIAKCNDVDGLLEEATLCFDWRLTDDHDATVILRGVDTESQCNLVYSTESGDSGDSGDAQTGAMGLGEVEYIGIAIAAGVLCICIIGFIVYKRRKGKTTQHTDPGISLQPYVPSGMGYDTYKQNQTRQKAKPTPKSPKKDKLRLKKPAPTSVASASADPPEEAESSTNANSKNALINVFDEDDTIEPEIVTAGTMDEMNNPFLNDGLFATGQTLADEPTLGTDAHMSAFDE